MGTPGIHIHIYQHHEVDLEWSLGVDASEQRIEGRACYPGQTKEIIGQADKVITALGKTSGVGTE
jgi:hypothetical protein